MASRERNELIDMGEKDWISHRHQCANPLLQKRCDGWFDFIALTCILDKQAQAENPSRILHFSRIGFGSSGVSRVDE